jgi:drug/metabolite transporter (DMT)-like permease
MQRRTTAFTTLAPGLPRSPKRRARASSAAAPVHLPLPMLHTVLHRRLSRAPAHERDGAAATFAKLVDGRQRAQQEFYHDQASSAAKEGVHAKSDDDDLRHAFSAPSSLSRGAAPALQTEEEAGLVRFSIMDRNFAIPGRYLLYCVPILWGTFGPAVRLLFAADPHPGPSLFNTERLLLSNLVYAPILFAEVSAIRTGWGNRKTTSETSTTAIAEDSSNDDPPVDALLSVKAGLELGAYVFCANVAQVIGLQSTSASRAAFLVQLQTVFIPVLAACFGLNKVDRNTWIGSIIAVAGVALLSSDKSHGTDSSLVGDSLEVLSALFFSAYVLRLSAYCNRINPASLVSVKIFVQGFLSTIWAVAVEAIAISTPHIPVVPGVETAHPWTLYAIAVNLGVISWTGLFVSALSGWLQTKGQQTVPASEAAIVFATQPLWASATAALVLGEAFGPKGFAGGALILFATVFSSLSSNGDDGEDEGIIEVEDDAAKKQ